MTFPDAEPPVPLPHAAGLDRRRAARKTPSSAGRQLTRLLARWAATRRLTPPEAEAIRLAARATPVDLGFDWWWRLLDPENGSVFRATPTRPASGGPGWLSGEPPLAPDGPGFATWLQDPSEYQPYLRLA